MARKQKPKCRHQKGLEHIGNCYYRCMECGELIDKDHREPSINQVTTIHNIITGGN